MAITDIDEQKLEAFVGLAATELGAALNAALVTLGDKLGLYKAMADGQPVSAAELAARTGTLERYVREWLNVQAASSFVEYDPEADAYRLPPEHALVLADDSTELSMTGVFEAANAAVAVRERLAERFVSGEGVGWHEHHHGLWHGTDRGVRRELQGAPGGRVAARARRRGRQARGRRARRRRRLRPRRLDDPDGRGVPRLALRRDRLPRGVDRGRAQARRGGGRRRPGDVRGRRRGGAARRGLRPRGLLRLVPRPRRPGRRGAARRAGARARRHLHARRAVRGRPGRGQLRPRRALPLRVLDARLHARGRCRSPGAPGSAPWPARRALREVLEAAGFGASGAPPRRR